MVKTYLALSHKIVSGLYEGKFTAKVAAVGSKRASCLCAHHHGTSAEAQACAENIIRVKGWKAAS